MLGWVESRQVVRDQFRTAAMKQQRKKTLDKKIACDGTNTQTDRQTYMETY